MTQKIMPTGAQTPDAGFADLDVALVEQTDVNGLLNVTDDNCGSSCGACTTGSA